MILYGLYPGFADCISDGVLHPRSTSSILGVVSVCIEFSSISRLVVRRTNLYTAGEYCMSDRTTSSARTEIDIQSLSSSYRQRREHAESVARQRVQGCGGVIWYSRVWSCRSVNRRWWSRL